jgi:hypothetical protein
MLLLATVAATLAALGGAQALPPCVPSKDAARALAAANLGDEESCCLLSTGFVSCAATAGDDGIVIDLTDLGTAEAGPLALAVADGAPFRGGLRALVAGSTQRYPLSISGARTFDIENVPNVEGWLVIHERKTAINEQILFVASTVARKSGGNKLREERVSAVTGAARFKFTRSQCKTLCGNTSFGGLHYCSPIKLCARATGDAPGDFVIATMVGDSYYALAVVNPASTNDFIYVDSMVAGSRPGQSDTVSAVFDLEVNPARNSYSVRASQVFITSEIRYDIPDFVLISG